LITALTLVNRERPRRVYIVFLVANYSKSSQAQVAQPSVSFFPSQVGELSQAK